MELAGIEPMTETTVYPSGTMRLRFRSAVDGAEDWALFRPGEPGKPVLVYLHGSFSGGDQLFTRQDIREHFLPVFLREGLGLLCPNLRGTTYMCPKTVADTVDLLDEVQQRYEISGGFLLLGGSGGASSAQIFAVLHPEKVRGLVALGACDLVDRLNYARDSEQTVLQELAHAIITAYGGTPEQVPGLYEAHSVIAHADRLTMPFLLAAGEADPLIPIEKVRLVAQALQHHPRFSYREVAGGDHDAPLFLPVEEMLGAAGYAMRQP